MFKKLFVLLLFILLFVTQSFAQLEPQCNNIIGQAFPQTNSATCIPYPLNPAITSSGIGIPVTRCFSWFYTNPVNLGYLLITGQCGPFPLYNSLTFNLYNQNCDTLIVSGNILPLPRVNTFIDYLQDSTWYNICYTWTPNCPQTDACPLINISALPIELISFEIEPLENKNVIKWSTASEINNDYFVLERASEINSWEIINITEGAGNSNTVLNYKFVDENLKSGINYYRLKQVDYDGNYEYSNIISAKSIFVEKYIIVPNPAKNILNIYSTSEKHSQVNVEIFNENGIKVYSKESTRLNSSDKLEIDIQNFSNGVYFVNILTLNNPMQFVSKFIKN